LFTRKILSDPTLDATATALAIYYFLKKLPAIFIQWLLQEKAGAIFDIGKRIGSNTHYQYGKLGRRRRWRRFVMRTAGSAKAHTLRASGLQRYSGSYQRLFYEGTEPGKPPSRVRSRSQTTCELGLPNNHVQRTFFSA
jgi:hypothetical protein